MALITKFSTSPINTPIKKPRATLAISVENKVASFITKAIAKNSRLISANF